MSDLPLAGFRIGVTAARKAEEQIGLLERRGAAVVHAPALSVDPNRIEETELLAATKDVLSHPVDIFVATTGIGLKSWFAAAERWGLLEDLTSHLGGAEILARGPKSVGALRRFGLRELWAPESEAFEDVLLHLRGRQLQVLYLLADGAVYPKSSDLLRDGKVKVGLTLANKPNFLLISKRPCSGLTFALGSLSYLGSPIAPKSTASDCKQTLWVASG